MTQNYRHKFDFECTYHIYNKSVSGRKIFIDKDDYNRYKNKLWEYFSSYTTIYAYCLIPNHFHILAKVKSYTDIDSLTLQKENSKAALKLLKAPEYIDLFLTDQMRRFFSSTALYTNVKYRKAGKLLLEKPKRILIDSEYNFYRLLCYIHHNPIHHNLTSNFGSWPHSSYLGYVNENKKLPVKEVFEDLGNENFINGKNAFIKLHRDFKKNYKSDEYFKS